MTRKIIPTEREITRLSRDYCAVHGLVLNRRNVISVHASYKGKSRYIRAGEKGQADWWYIVPDGSGRHGELEIKRPGARPDDHQIRWLLSVNAAGGVACWIDGADMLGKSIPYIVNGHSVLMGRDGTYNLVRINREQCARLNFAELMHVQGRIDRAEFAAKLKRTKTPPVF